MDVGDQLQAPCMADGQRFQRVAEIVRSAERDLCQSSVPAFRSWNIKKVVTRESATRGRLLNEFRVLPPSARRQSRVAAQTRPADYRFHRCADFMAMNAAKHALGPVGPPRLPPWAQFRFVIPLGKARADRLPFNGVRTVRFAR